MLNHIYSLISTSNIPSIMDELDECTRIRYYSRGSRAIRTMLWSYKRLYTLWRDGTGICTNEFKNQMIDFLKECLSVNNRYLAVVGAYPRKVIVRELECLNDTLRNLLKDPILTKFIHNNIVSAVLLG